MITRTTSLAMVSDTSATKQNHQIKEIWREVKNYESLYYVSSLGRIKNHLGKLRVIKDGKVGLSFNGVQEILRVSDLVANAFLSNPEKKRYVRNKDGNLDNNVVYNLQWTNEKPTSRISEFEVKEILDLVDTFDGQVSAKDISVLYNISVSTVAKILNRTHSIFQELPEINRPIVPVDDSNYMFNQEDFKSEMTSK